MRRDSRLETATFNTNGLRRTDRFDAYSAFLQPWKLTRIAHSRDWPAESHAFATRMAINDMVLVHGAHNGVRMVRTDTDVLRAAPDVLCVMKYLHGGARGLVMDTPYHNHAGTVGLTSAHQSIRAASDGPAEFLTVQMPSDVVGFDGQYEAIGPAMTGPRASMLGSATMLLFHVLATATAEEATALTNGYAALIRGLFFSSSVDDRAIGPVPIERYHSIRHYVNQNARSPSLTAASVCGSLGISRATLYRAFENDGGLMRYVQQRRLSGAFDELARATPRSGLIKAVAARWGFEDQARFAKLFKRQTNLSPSDVVGLGHTTDTAATRGRLTRPERSAVR